MSSSSDLAAGKIWRYLGGFILHRPCFLQACPERVGAFLVGWCEPDYRLTRARIRVRIDEHPPT